MSTESNQRLPLSEDIAIIGMACIFPGAPDIQTFWHNIVSKVDAITDVSSDRWDSETFFDSKSTRNDRVYCNRGGFLGELATFNPLDYGIMPIAVDGGDPSQFLALKVAHQALADAGYLNSSVNWERTEIILGRGNYLDRGICNVTQHSRIIEQTLKIIKSLYPEYNPEQLQAIRKELKASLPHFGFENAPSLIPNITTGRIANRLDLMGANFTVDAACASSLIATDLGMRDLLTHKCDLALVGGIFIIPDVPFHIIFCQLNALSKQSQIRPFDKKAEGTVIGEGLGIVALKRLAEAERDGDRIYAVVKGVGVSSDGRAVSITAPRLEGQELALRRAYEFTGISPQTIGLIEAHGTGTPTGDTVEIEALKKVFGTRNHDSPSCALGTIKSMIGHTMPAAGAAGLIKAALALYHKVLPPTLHCDEPHHGLKGTSFYINANARPWIHGSKDTPRRAGVNAFGFGGINSHVILEEHPSTEGTSTQNLYCHWDTEVCILQGKSRQSLMQKIRLFQDYLKNVLSSVPTQVSLKDLAYTLNAELNSSSYTLALVVSSLQEMLKKLEHAHERLSDSRCKQIKDRTGIYFFEKPLGGKLAFLFPGEGSQYLNMLSDLCIHFPEVRTCFDEIDTAFIGHQRGYLPSQTIFPTSSFSKKGRSEEDERKIWQMDGAIEAVFTANKAMFRLLTCLGLQPDSTVGHSTGEFSAIFAAGLTDINLGRIRLLNHIYEEFSKKGNIPEADMLAVGAPYANVSVILKELEGSVYIAMDNCPHQVVLVVERKAIDRVINILTNKGLIYEKLPFNRPYHTPLFEKVCKNFRQFFSEQPIYPPKTELWSCATMQPYPKDALDIHKLVADQWMQPVQFRKTIEMMYDSGVRIFVEAGPRGNLIAFVDDILRGKHYLAVASNVLRRSGITQLNHLVGLLAAQGIPMHLDYLYARRKPSRLSLETVADITKNKGKSDASITLSLGFPSMGMSPRTSPSLKDEMGKAIDVTIPSGNTPKPPDSATSISTLQSPLEQEKPAEITSQETSKSPEMVAQESAVVGAEDKNPSTSPPLMEEYMMTMEHFLEVQREVMQAYLSGKHMATTLEERVKTGVKRLDQQKYKGTNSNVQPFPFIGTIISHVPGQELEAYRQVSLTEDILLRDHALGREASVKGNKLSPLHVIPMTVSIEIMAEAALLLLPGKVLTSMKDIRAHRWIPVEEKPVTLQIKAQKVTSGIREEVKILIQNMGSMATPKSSKETPVVEGTMVLEDAYPAPPETIDSSLQSKRHPKHTAEEMYKDKLMFHGPRFQGVVSMDECGKDGILGHLQVLPNTEIFRTNPTPPFITDPFLLDAAGQLVGYWPLEYLETGFLAFPIRLKELHLFGPNYPPYEHLRCQVRIRQVTPKTINADIDIIGPDERVWARLIGWEDWRFDLAPEFFSFWRNPQKLTLSVPWNTPILKFPIPESFECCRLEKFQSDQISLKELWLHLIINRSEQETWQNLKKPEAQKIEWLMGRLVAKDAVRMFLKKHYGMELHPADIEITSDENGRPLPQGDWTQDINTVPALSLAHTDGIAVAVTGHCPNSHGVGIDIERIRSRNQGFEKLAFKKEEINLLSELSKTARQEWMIRFWCTKEAVAKALGRGLIEGPQSIRVEEFNVRTGMVKVALQDKLAQKFPEFSANQIIAHTTKEKDYIIASSLCELA